MIVQSGPVLSYQRSCAAKCEHDPHTGACVGERVPKSYWCVSVCLCVVYPKPYWCVCMGPARTIAKLLTTGRQPQWAAPAWHDRCPPVLAYSCPRRKPEYIGNRARVLLFGARTGCYVVALDRGKDLSLKSQCLAQAGLRWRRAARRRQQEAWLQVVWYCSRECQRADWKVHKPAFMPGGRKPTWTGLD